MVQMRFCERFICGKDFNKDNHGKIDWNLWRISTHLITLFTLSLIYSLNDNLLSIFNQDISGLKQVSPWICSSRLEYKQPLWFFQRIKHLALIYLGLNGIFHWYSKSCITSSHYWVLKRKLLHSAHQKTKSNLQQRIWN